MKKIDFEDIEGTIRLSGISRVISEQSINGCPFVVSEVPKSMRDDFHSHGFEVYAQYQDYWNVPLKSLGSEYSEFTFLREEDCAIASEITAACHTLSRGFDVMTAKWFRNWMNGNDGLHNSAVLTSNVNDRIVGISCTATYGHDSENGAVVWVRMIGVQPDFQGHGIGTKLLKQTLQYGVEHGAKRAFLHVDVENTNAIHIYTKSGFVRDGNEDDAQIDMIWGNSVIINEEDYNDLMETLYLSSNKELREKLIKGIETPLDECLSEDEV